MRNSWCRRSISLLLLAFMLTAQAASASHDIAHQNVEHTELCQAFVTADGAPAIEAEHAVFLFSRRAELPALLTSHAELELFSLHHSARAPPLS